MNGVLAYSRSLMFFVRAYSTELHKEENNRSDKV